MKRRKALHQIGLGVTGGLMLPSFLTSCSPNDPGPEVNYAGTVAILGAGAAGLYVADILRSKGIKVKVFEARDQIGGRIRSLRNQTTEHYPIIPFLSSDFPLELGAQTIIGTDSIMGKIFQAYRLATFEFTPESNHFVLGNVAQSAADWAGDGDFQAAMNFRQNLKSLSGSALTAQQAIQSAGIGTRAYGMLNGQIGNPYGSDNDIIGIGELGEEETLRIGDGKILSLKGNPLQDLLISRFNAVQQFVQLNTPITSIQYGSDPIVLTAGDGTTYEADKVIVTVPVSMLKNGGISFSPGLPGAFTGSLAKIGMGASLRVIIEFKQNFWGESAGFILGSTNVPEFLSVGLNRSVFNATLSVTVNGAKAEGYSSMTDSDLIAAILADIDLLYSNLPGSQFPGKGTQYVRKKVVDGLETDPIFLREDWTTNEFILGGYSYPLAGATNEDRKALGQPIGNKLFFAGEATDTTGQAGMVNGALASAERVAEEVVISILNP